MSECNCENCKLLEKLQHANSRVQEVDAENIALKDNIKELESELSQAEERVSELEKELEYYLERVI